MECIDIRYEIEYEICSRKYSTYLYHRRACRRFSRLVSLFLPHK
jgi:hypothetical protein